MTKREARILEFASLRSRKIEASFSGGAITSDGGILLLREVEKKIKLLDKVAKVIPDLRDQSKITHSIKSMLQQRVLGIASGYEDLNDHATLRKDIAFQVGVNTIDDLASSPTLCRFENSTTKQIAFDIHKIIIDQFIESRSETPEELILDFDATDDLIHGNQVGKFFHGYYKNYCFLPLYVFCGQHLLVSYLRTSNRDAARGAWPILSMLVKYFRRVWPNVRIIFRGDSGFCRHEMLDWCEKNDVYYIIGIAGNKCIEKIFKPTIDEAKKRFEDTQEKQRIFTEFMYGAKTWSKQRKIVGKAEHTKDGANPRTIVTNLSGDPQELYDNCYCARGNMENRIKEQQLDLFADRTSCHNWWPNQFRLLLASLAYTLIEYLREFTLNDTELANAQVGTIRSKLFKIGAIILKNTRRIVFKLSEHYPYQSLFEVIWQRLTVKILTPT
jgi:hypothetical protein